MPSLTLKPLDLTEAPTARMRKASVQVQADYSALLYTYVVIKQ